MTPFWMVWSKYKVGISKRFDTKKEAEDEAIRLAKRFGQGCFWVMEAVEVVHLPTVEPVITSIANRGNPQLR